MSGFINSDGERCALGSPTVAHPKLMVTKLPRSLSFRDDTEVFIFENQDNDETSTGERNDELQSLHDATDNDNLNSPGLMRFSTRSESRRVKRSATAHVDSLPGATELALPTRSQLWQRRHTRDYLCKDNFASRDSNSSVDSNASSPTEHDHDSSYQGLT